MRIILFYFLCFKHEFRIQWWNIQEWRINNSWFKSNNDNDYDNIRCNKTHKGTWQLGKWHWIFDVMHCNECWFREYLACKLSGRVEHILLRIIKLNLNLFGFFFLFLWKQFPFTALENGGGAFLIPYLIVLLIIGRPLYYLEMLLGQFSSRSSIKVFDLAPALRGNHLYYTPEFILLNKW